MLSTSTPLEIETRRISGATLLVGGKTRLAKLDMRSLRQENLRASIANREMVLINFGTLARRVEIGWNKIIAAVWTYHKKVPHGVVGGQKLLGGRHIPAVPHVLVEVAFQPQERFADHFWIVGVVLDALDQYADGAKENKNKKNAQI